MSKSSQKIYKITFYNQNNIYELYAKETKLSNLMGFIELSGLLFGTTNSLVVDPSAERLKSEFSEIKTTHIPLHAIIRIDEVEKGGIAKIREIPSKGNSNITPFPSAPFAPMPPRDNT